MPDLSITLSYAELLALTSAVVTINNVYGASETLDNLECTLREAVYQLSSQHVANLEVEA